jgi:hypothetical protein
MCKEKGRVRSRIQKGILVGRKWSREMVRNTRHLHLFLSGTKSKLSLSSARERE